MFDKLGKLLKKGIDKFKNSASKPEASDKNTENSIDSQVTSSVAHQGSGSNKEVPKAYSAEKKREHLGNLSEIMNSEAFKAAAAQVSGRGGVYGQLPISATKNGHHHKIPENLRENPKIIYSALPNPPENGASSYAQNNKIIRGTQSGRGGGIGR